MPLILEILSKIIRRSNKNPADTYNASKYIIRLSVQSLHHETHHLIIVPQNLLEEKNNIQRA